VFCLPSGPILPATDALGQPGSALVRACATGDRQAYSAHYAHCVTRDA